MSFRRQSLVEHHLGLRADTDVLRQNNFARGFDSRWPAPLGTYFAQATQACVRFLSTGEALHARPWSETPCKMGRHRRKVNWSEAGRHVAPHSEISAPS